MSLGLCICYSGLLQQVLGTFVFHLVHEFHTSMPHLHSQWSCFFSSLLIHRLNWSWMDWYTWRSLPLPIGFDILHIQGPPKHLLSTSVDTMHHVPSASLFDTKLSYILCDHSYYIVYQMLLPFYLLQDDAIYILKVPFNPTMLPVCPHFWKPPLLALFPYCWWSWSPNGLSCSCSFFLSGDAVCGLISLSFIKSQFWPDPKCGLPPYSPQSPLFFWPWLFHLFGGSQVWSVSLSPHTHLHSFPLYLHLSPFGSELLYVRSIWCVLDALGAAQFVDIAFLIWSFSVQQLLLLRTKMQIFRNIRFRTKIP